MKSDDFFRLVRTWLTIHLPRARRLSPHTIRSYKTALNTLLAYLRETRHLELADITFGAINHATITGFTTWLLDTKHLAASSANQRVAAASPSWPTAPQRTRHSSRSGWTSNKSGQPAHRPMHPTR